MTPELRRDIDALLKRFGPAKLSRLLGISLSAVRNWQWLADPTPRPWVARRIEALAAEAEAGLAPITMGEVISALGDLRGCVTALSDLAPGLMPADKNGPWLRGSWVPRSAIRKLADYVPGGAGLQLRALLGGETDE